VITVSLLVKWCYREQRKPTCSEQSISIELRVRLHTYSPWSRRLDALQLDNCSEDQFNGFEK
jgi:hypothetical protein